MKLEANVILGKCYNKELYGMRVQKINNDWIRTWSFPVREETAAEEGFDHVQITGSVLAAEDYPGCPYCEEKRFIVYGSCHKISCYHGEKISTCQWCGNVSRVDFQNSLEVSGGGY